MTNKKITALLPSSGAENAAPTLEPQMEGEVNDMDLGYANGEPWRAPNRMDEYDSSPSDISGEWENICYDDDSSPSSDSSQTESMADDVAELHRFADMMGPSTSRGDSSQYSGKYQPFKVYNLPVDSSTASLNEAIQLHHTLSVFEKNSGEEDDAYEEIQYEQMIKDQSQQGAEGGNMQPTYYYVKSAQTEDDNSIVLYLNGESKKQVSKRPDKDGMETPTSPKKRKLD